MIELPAKTNRKKILAALNKLKHKDLMQAHGFRGVRYTIQFFQGLQIQTPLKHKQLQPVYQITLRDDKTIVQGVLNTNQPFQ